MYAIIYIVKARSTLKQYASYERIYLCFLFLFVQLYVFFYFYFLSVFYKFFFYQFYSLMIPFTICIGKFDIGQSLYVMQVQVAVMVLLARIVTVQLDARTAFIIPMKCFLCVKNVLIMIITLYLENYLVIIEERNFYDFIILCII